MYITFFSHTTPNMNNKVKLAKITTEKNGIKCCFQCLVQVIILNKQPVLALENENNMTSQKAEKAVNK